MPKKCYLADDSSERKLGETEKPEVKYTPPHRCKEKLEEKMIEFIDLTSKQTAAEMALIPAAPRSKRLCCHPTGSYGQRHICWNHQQAGPMTQELNF